MALEAIALQGPEARVSDHVARLIAICSRGWERFFADHDQTPRFVPSVPERVFAVLVEVTTRQLPPTRVFCEWGSGFGTATCLDFQRLMMASKNGVGQIIKACVTVVTLVALTGWLCVIKATLDDLCGCTRGARDSFWPT